MRTGFESTLMGIEPGTSEVKGEWSDHYADEVPLLNQNKSSLFFTDLMQLDEADSFRAS